VSGDPFSRKLDTVLKALSMSRGRLAQEAGLDKSLVGRWVSGQVVPSAHNLERVTAAIARRVPGFTGLDWDRPLPALAERVGGSIETPAPVAGSLPPGTLTFPFDITGPARVETARRGEEYCGFYYNYRFAFGRPGRIARVATLIRPRDGLLEVRKGAVGFEHRGWGLLMLNRLYIMQCEEKFEAMGFLITNAGQQPKARCLSGIILGVSSEGLLMPKAAPFLMMRHADLTGDEAADIATYEAMKLSAGVIDRADVPEVAMAHISRDFGPRAFAEGQSDLLNAPFVDLPDQGDRSGI
jgi:transcriptional regulator with XRE-family HTH domain